MSRRKRNRLAKQSASQVQSPPKSVRDRQARSFRIAQLSARVTFGPIPSAEEMERYRQVQTDLPERIMRQYERRTEMAEKQSEHRMGMEADTVGNNILMERLGWASATGLGAIVLVGSIWLIHIGKSLEGLAGVVLALASLLGLYVFARHDQIQEIAKKRAAEMVKETTMPEQLELLTPGQG